MRWLRSLREEFFELIKVLNNSNFFKALCYSFITVYHVGENILGEFL